MLPDEIKFVQQKAYKPVRELGEGATGKTVLLHEELLDEYVVCKKFSPMEGLDRSELFVNFKREIKLLLKLNHINIVRIFNYFLYPSIETGYILLEYVDGKQIDAYIREHPDKINDVFKQTIAGFSHLEYKRILHRDLRMSNILVDNAGVVKIIDLGFGKQIDIPKDENKSISLTWQFKHPSEFSSGEYSTRTEVYFVGMLFLEVIQSCGIDDFRFSDILTEMCHWSCDLRTQSFHDIHNLIFSDNSKDSIQFSSEEQLIYRTFADELLSHINKLDDKCKYAQDWSKVISDLDEAYNSIMLENIVPDASTIIRCFLSGGYNYNPYGLVVSRVQPFLGLLKSSKPQRLKIIFSNLHKRFDTLDRYTQPTYDDDIPF